MSAPTARTVRFEVAEDDVGLRLDQLLARRIPELSRRQARVLLDIGGVFVDRRRVKVAGRRLRAGQTVEANLGGALAAATKEVGHRARERDAGRLPPHRVVHEDDAIVVVDKPAGLITAPTPESDRQNLADVLGRERDARIFVVHRLDLPTSGLLVFARTGVANRLLSDAFKAHDIERSYLAAVRGVLDRAVTVDRPLSGRRAVTHLAPLRDLGGVATLVRATLETGRTHQIRLHCQGLGHPVLGDATHGERTDFDPPRMALHAAVLGFVHPTTREPLRFESEWPADLAGWLAGFEGDAS